MAENINFIRYPLLVEWSLECLKNDKEFQNAFNETVIKTPEENEKLENFKQKKNFESEISTDDDSGLEENTIQKFECAKKEMLNSYSDVLNNLKSE